MYIESSHRNNVPIAKFVNDCVYSTPNPSQQRDTDCRTTINGFPIRVFINDESMGVYNLNIDRWSTESFGYSASNFPRMLVYEIAANSDTSAGAFYKYGANATSAGMAEQAYYARDFTPIYPPSRTTTTDDYAEIRRVVNFVNDASDELFRENFDLYFNREYTLRYFLVVQLFGLVDSLGLIGSSKILID